MPPRPTPGRGFGTMPWTQSRKRFSRRPRAAPCGCAAAACWNRSAFRRPLDSTVQQPRGEDRGKRFSRLPGCRGQLEIYALLLQTMAGLANVVEGVSVVDLRQDSLADTPAQAGADAADGARLRCWAACVPAAASVDKRGKLQ